MDVQGEFHRYANGRHWLSPGWPLLKQVGSVPVDNFCVNGRTFSVNSAWLGPVFQADHEGQPQRRIEGGRAIPAGHFLPVALWIERSIDCRYMGPVSVSKIRGRLSSKFTF